MVRPTKQPTTTTAPRKSPMLFRKGKIPACALHMPVAITTGDQAYRFPKVTHDSFNRSGKTYNGDPGQEFDVLPCTLLHKRGMIPLAPRQTPCEFFEAPLDLLQAFVRNVEIEEGLLDNA